MDRKELSDLASAFADYKEIKLAYFFGSKAEGKGGVLSDFDFAFYIDEKDHKKLYELKLSLINRLSLLLNTDKVDVVILNLIDSPEMKYNIIKNGKLILEREPFKVLIEPKILNEYFDFHSMLVRNNLTKA
jgi:predicted nucleotidyltransferase